MICQWAPAVLLNGVELSGQLFQSVLTPLP